MRSLLRYLALVFCLLLSVNYFVLAQDDDVETMPLGGAFTIDVPENWEVTTPTASGYFWVTDDSTIRIRTYGATDQDIYNIELGNLADMMEFLVTEAFETPDYDEDDVETMTIGDHEGVRYTYDEQSEGQTYPRTIMLFAFEENGFIIASNIVSSTGSELNEDDVSALETALATVELQDAYTFYEGTVLPIPEGWQLVDDLNIDFSYATYIKDTLQFQMRLFPSYGAVVGLETPANFLAYMFGGSSFSEIASFRRDRLEETTAAGFDAVWYPIDSDRLNSEGMYERGILAFIIPNNSAFTVRITSETPDEPIDEVFELIDELEPGTVLVCVLFADPGTRIRSEPNTAGELVRQTGDEAFVASAQTTDDAGNTWFFMGEGWVRFDVVFYDVNTCENVPIRD